MAISAQIVALCSFVLSMVEWREARRHLELTSQPSLEVNYYHNEEGAGWRITNDGLGTARLRGFRMFVNGGRVNEDWENLLSLLDLPENTTFRFLKPTVGTRYEASASALVVWFPPGIGANRVQEIYKGIVIQTCYCSLYDECWLTSIDGAYRDDKGEDLRDDDCSRFSAEPKSRWWQG